MRRVSRKRAKIAACAALALVGGLLVWLVLADPQPHYEGQPILKHFLGWEFGSPAAQTGPTIQGMPGGGTILTLPSFRPQIFSAAGPEAVPWLLRVIRREDSWLKHAYMKVQPGLFPASIRKFLPVPIPSVITRGKAVSALAMIAAKHPDAAQPWLVEALERGTKHERLAAVDIFGRLGTRVPMVRQALIGNLGYNEPEVQRAILDALMRMGGTKEDVFLALADRWARQAIRPEAMSYFENSLCVLINQLETGSRWPLPALAALRTNDFPKVRVEALYAFWRIDASDRFCGPELLREFSRAGSEARLQAGTYLAWNASGMHLSAGEAVPVLLEGLQNSETAVRAAAALALAHFGAEARPALPELIAATKASELSVKLASARAIGSIGPPAAEAIPQLVKMLDDGDAQAVIAKLLGSLGPAAQSAAPKLVEVLANPSRPHGKTEIRVEAARALGQIRCVDEPVLKALREAAEHSDEKVREAAFEALRTLEPSRQAAPEAGGRP